MNKQMVKRVAEDNSKGAKKVVEMEIIKMDKGIVKEVDRSKTRVVGKMAEMVNKIHRKEVAANKVVKTDDKKIGKLDVKEIMPRANREIARMNDRVVVSRTKLESNKAARMDARRIKKQRKEVNQSNKVQIKDVKKVANRSKTVRMDAMKTVRGLARGTHRKGNKETVRMDERVAVRMKGRQGIKRDSNEIVKMVDREVTRNGKEVDRIRKVVVRTKTK